VRLEVAPGIKNQLTISLDLSPTPTNTYSWWKTVYSRKIPGWPIRAMGEQISKSGAF
jgi:hypothetical protein